MSKSKCFHCGLPNPHSPLTLDVQGDKKNFCCVGCQSAAKTIIDAGLSEYYRFHQPDQHPVENDLTEKIQTTFLIYDRDDVQQEFVQNVDEFNRECILVIEGISCSACTWLIEKRLLQLDGVTRATVNAGTHRLSLTWNPQRVSLSAVFHSLFLIGYRASPFSPDQEELAHQRTSKKFILRLGVAGLGMMQAMMNAVALYSGQITEIHERWLWWTSLFLTLPVIFISAWPFFTAAWHSLKGKQLSMDVSVSIAILSAFLASVYATVVGHGEVYFESVNMFTFFLVLSRYMEFRARTLAHAQSSTVNNHLPQTCELVTPNGTHFVPTRDLQPGDIIKLLPGDTCPLDGKVKSGASEFDESSFTGEFKGIKKSVGDKVSAGTINQFQPIQIEIEKHASGSAFSLLQSLMERASSEKSRIAELADKGSRQFIWSTLIISFIIGMVWLWVDADRAFWIVISVLVVTCPCALSLATPTALAQSTLFLKKHGIIVTRGYALERLARLKHIAFDKTGTLTEGVFSIYHSELTDEAHRLGISIDDALQIAALLEKNSEHSISTAFKTVKITNNSFTLENIEHLPSQGVKGQTSLGEWFIGSAKSDDTLGTALQLTLNETPVARFIVKDQLRQTVQQTFIETNNLGIQTHVLTGDNNPLAERELRDVNLSGEYRLGCRPEDKVVWISARADQDVAVVGDGLNDAPLLAKAPLSIAVLNATDMTKSQADIILLTSDLQSLTMAVRTARKTQRIIRQNLAWALLYNAIALPIASLGWVSPWQAAIGMSVSSLIVVGNALRLRK
jgi:Cu2+-exporting ATPase